jgi:hypothetical protein
MYDYDAEAVWLLKDFMRAIGVTSKFWPRLKPGMVKLLENWDKKNSPLVAATQPIPEKRPRGKAPKKDLTNVASEPECQTRKRKETYSVVSEEATVKRQKSNVNETAGSTAAHNLQEPDATRVGRHEEIPLQFDNNNGAQFSTRASRQKTFLAPDQSKYLVAASSEFSKKSPLGIPGLDGTVDLVKSTLANFAIDENVGGKLQIGGATVETVQKRPTCAAASRARTKKNGSTDPNSTDPPTSNTTGRIDDAVPLTSTGIHHLLRKKKHHNAKTQHDVLERLSENHAQSAEEDNALSHNKRTEHFAKGIGEKQEVIKAQEEEAARQRKLHEARRHGRYLDKKTAETFRVKHHTVLLPLDEFYQPGKERASMHMLDTRRYTERLLETARAEGREVKLWMGGSTPPREPQMEEYFEENEQWQVEVGIEGESGLSGVLW